jgi:RluA family pseudouridine synthase
MQADILYIDNHMLVVNKPPGLLSQADRTGDPDLLSQARQYLKQTFNKPGNVFAGLVHRLDRPASGVLVLARTSKAAARLSEQFRNATALKKYLALVQGRVSGSGTCRDYLLKDEQQRVRIVSPDHAGARAAELDWRAVAFGPHESLLEIILKTGRSHQIRVQLAASGMPIVGDLRYGAHVRFDGQNLALHCCCLGLAHPVRKIPMRWMAAPPPTWQGHFNKELEIFLTAERTQCALLEHGSSSAQPLDGQIA